jgi:CRISPR-associated protein Csb2
MIVAAWLRNACAEALKQEGEPEEWVDRYVHGHEQEKSTGHHMSFVPLPTIGHPNTDGRLRRALVIEPLEAEGRAVNLLEVKLAGEVISGEDGSCQLVAPEAADPVLDRYLRSARVWRSATPVVLHGFNIVRGKIGVAKTERLLLAALEFGGHPASLVEGLAFQPAPLWSGAEASARVQVPAHLEKWPRYHVEVRFREKVAGPVFAGIGRHCGLGIFAAVE